MPHPNVSNIRSITLTAARARGLWQRMVTGLCSAKYLLCLLMLLALLLSPPLAMASDDPFTIDNIAVTSKGASATEARTLAIASAEQQAFSLLLQRMAASGTAPTSPTLTPEVISGLVSGMEVHNEKITPGYYSATVDISFNPGLVNDTLASSGLSSLKESASPAKKLATVLILPVIVNDKNPPAIVPADPWYENWKTTTATNTPFNYKLAAPDDLSPALLQYLASPTASTGLDQNALTQEISALKQRYHASLCASVTAYTTHTLGGSETVSYLVNFTNTPPAAMLFPADGNPATALEQNYRTMATAMNSYLTTQWQKQLRSAISRIRVFIPISSLADWLDVQRQLRAVDSIDTMSVEKITTRQITTQLSFSVPYDELVKQLEASSLSLSKTNEGAVLTKRPPSSSQPHSL